MRTRRQVCKVNLRRSRGVRLALFRQSYWSDPVASKWPDCPTSRPEKALPVLDDNLLLTFVANSSAHSQRSLQNCSLLSCWDNLPNPIFKMFFKQQFEPFCMQLNWAIHGARHLQRSYLYTYLSMSYHLYFSQKYFRIVRKDIRSYGVRYNVFIYK